jgi:hypothetical protein
MFSFNTQGNDNCILVGSSIGTYGVWVHWAMTIGANNAITHYVNGTASTAPASGGAYCNRSTGSLVLGHDQDSVGGGLDGNQVRPTPPALPPPRAIRVSRP